MHTNIGLALKPNYLSNSLSVKEQSQGIHSLVGPIRATLLFSDWPKRAK